MSYSLPSELDPLNPSLPFFVNTDGGPFVANEVLRHLPGKRLVCVGAWRDHKVVAKIYLDPHRARIHAEREAAGIRALMERGIKTATLLYQHKESDRVTLLFEHISNARSAADGWAHAGNREEEHDILRALVETVAALHIAGVVQEDLHFGNFLLAENGVYTLDGAAIRVYAPPLSRTARLDNLGLLFAQLEPRFDAWVPELYAHYLKRIGNSGGDVEDLLRSISKRRTGRKREVLTKAYRRCSAFEMQRDRSSFAVWDREYDSPTLRQILKDPDAAMQAGSMLKDGRTSTVVRIDIDGKALLVKRYNLKNPLHAINRALRETRASISWRNAHRLRFYGLPTPRPVALLEKRCGPFRRVSYFICEYIEGVPANRYLRDPSVTPSDRQIVIETICTLFQEFAALGIAHGDTKAANFLVHEQHAWLIDLDALKEYRDIRSASAALRRDRQRFFRNWVDSPELKARFEACLNAPPGNSE